MEVSFTGLEYNLYLKGYSEQEELKILSERKILKTKVKRAPSFYKSNHINPSHCKDQHFTLKYDKNSSNNFEVNLYPINATCLEDIVDIEVSINNFVYEYIKKHDFYPTVTIFIINSISYGAGVPYGLNVHNLWG